MKNRLFLIIATAACLGSFTACSQDNDIVVPDGDLKAAISFNVNIGQTPEPEASMRGYAANTNGSTYTFTSGQKVALAVSGVSGGRTPVGETNQEIKLYTVGTGTGSQALTYSSGGTSAYEFDWKSQSEVISVRAWSNGKSSTTTDDPSNTIFTVDKDQSGTETTDVKELLYSPAIRHSYGSINVPLFHQMSRIVVNAKGTLSKKTPTDLTTITIDGIYIGSSNDIDVPGPIKNSGTFSRPSNDFYSNAWTYTNYQAGKSYDGSTAIADEDKYGSWGDLSGAVNIKCKTESLTSGYTATASAIIIPATYANATKFITIDTSNGIYNFSLGSSITFKPGHQYTFNITNLNEIKLNVTVTAWETDTTNSKTINFSE